MSPDLADGVRDALERGDPEALGCALRFEVGREAAERLATVDADAVVDALECGDVAGLTELCGLRSEDGDVLCEVLEWRRRRTPR